MELEVTKNFSKQFEKLDVQTQRQVLAAFEKLADNPKSVKFEEKTGPAKGVFTMRVDGGNRVAFTKNAEGNLVPAFVGNHNDYDRFLSDTKNLKPEKLLGADNARIKTMELDLPEKLTSKGMLGKTSFAIGNIKLHGLTGAVITGGIILGLGGTARDAVAGTTPGHVGMELAEGDIRGATEALIVDGAGDVGCVVGGIAGAKGGAAIGVFFEGIGAIPGGIIGAVGGCIVGGLAASETAQALWNLAVGKDTDKTEIADPSATLKELNDLGIRNVPDKISADMPADLKNLVMYKNNVASSIDTLNQAAAELNTHKDSQAAKDAFVAASAKFQETADAYKYSAATMEDPKAVQDYVYKMQAQELSSASTTTPSAIAASTMPPPPPSSSTQAYAR